MATQVDGAVEVFLRRALPHYLTGKSVEDSLRAVLDDDARLVAAALARGGAQYFPTPDERGVSRITPDRTGDLIASHLSSQVHAALRAPSVA
jgi:hypothetical protein